MFCLDPVSGTPVLFPHQLLSAKHKIRSNNMESVRSGKKNTVLSYRKLKLCKLKICNYMRSELNQGNKYK